MKEEELWAQERLTLKSSLEEVRLQALEDVFATVLFLAGFRASSIVYDSIIVIICVCV